MERPKPDNELLVILRRWEGSQVVVRVVAARDDLVAVFAGRLGGRSSEKDPALFWPIESADHPKAERIGIYLHPELYEDARIHEGDFVVEFRQANVTVNIRRL